MITLKNTLKTIALLLLLFFTISCTENIKIYPAPEGIELSSAFNVVVEGQQVPVYKTKVPPKDPIPRLNHSRSEFGFASLASFDMNAEARITVTYPGELNTVKKLPTSFGI